MDEEVQLAEGGRVPAATLRREVADRMASAA